MCETGLWYSTTGVRCRSTRRGQPALVAGGGILVDQAFACCTIQQPTATSRSSALEPVVLALLSAVRSAARWARLRTVAARVLRMFFFADAIFGTRSPSESVQRRTMHNGRPAEDRPSTGKNVGRAGGDVKAPHCFDTLFRRATFRLTAGPPRAVALPGFHPPPIPVGPVTYSSLRRSCFSRSSRTNRPRLRGVEAGGSDGL